jgi:hypothetical protein
VVQLKKANLGKHFLNEVLAKTNKIQQSPFFFSIKFSGTFRFAKIKIFAILLYLK